MKTLDDWIERAKKDYAKKAGELIIFYRVFTISPAMF
jgi:hypothetical protein